MKPGHVAMTNSDGGALWGRPSKDLAGQHGPGEALAGRGECAAFWPRDRAARVWGPTG